MKGKGAKTIKKVASIILALAMVVTGVNYTPVSVNAADRISIQLNGKTYTVEKTSSSIVGYVMGTADNTSDVNARFVFQWDASTGPDKVTAVVKQGAAASDAIIIGFQVRPALPARRLAEKEGVEIRLYSIIYDAIEEVKSAMEGMLSPEIKEEITANVEVLQVFKITKVGTIAGCMVREGKIKRSNKVRVIRDGIVVHSGELESLKRFKDDVKEVVAGLDCGLNIVNYNDIQVGDIIEAYEETEIKKTL